MKIILVHSIAFSNKRFWGDFPLKYIYILVSFCRWGDKEISWWLEWPRGATLHRVSISMMRPRPFFTPSSGIWLFTSEVCDRNSEHCAIVRDLPGTRATVASDLQPGGSACDPSCPVYLRLRFPSVTRSPADARLLSNAGSILVRLSKEAAACYLSRGVIHNESTKHWQ